MPTGFRGLGIFSRCHAAWSNISIAQTGSRNHSLFSCRSKASAAQECEWESPSSRNNRQNDLKCMGITFPKGLLVDAAGTLIIPSESVSEVYLRYGRPYGVTVSKDQLLKNFRVAYNAPWTDASIRYEGDGREFWKRVVAESVECENEELFEEIYKYYEMPQAWKLAPGSVAALTKLHDHGIKIAVVSNFDTRLRPILRSLNILHLFDVICVSAEVGAEKPNPYIFECALQQLGLRANEVVHFGDDRRNDVWGARHAGIMAWLWNVDVESFDEVAERVLTGRCYL